MIGRLRFNMPTKRIGMTLISSVFFMLLTGLTQAYAQQDPPLRCEDRETWVVDRSALNKVFANYNNYLTQPEPILINLKALGAGTGQPVIVYSQRYLTCARDSYGPYTGIAGNGQTIQICKRPKC